MKRFTVVWTVLFTLATSAATCRADTRDEQDAAAVAQAFFDAWETNQLVDLGTGRQRPLKEIFLQSPLLTAGYKETYRQHVERAGGISWNPIALGSASPGCPHLQVTSTRTEHDFGVVVLSGMRGTATQILSVRVLKVGGRWQIDGLNCTVRSSDASSEAN